MNIPFALQQIRNTITVTRKELSGNWIVQTVDKFTFLLIGCSIALVVWQWNNLPPQIPIWYSRPWGDDQLAHPAWLLVLPVSSILWYAINFFFVAKLILPYRIFIQILYVSSLTVTVLSFISLVKIIFIVI